MDYCNSIHAGSPVNLINQIQLVLNAAARLLYGWGRFDHITDIFRNKLHWLRVSQRIAFKCALLVYKALNGLSPSYISRSCVRSSSVQTRYALRSASRDTLAIPRTKTKFGERSFSVAGPTIWNSLPDSVKAADTVGIFKSRLKTHLFGLSYDLPLWKRPCFQLVCAYGAI